MKLAQIYAQALVASPEGENAVGGLVAHLKSRGRMKLLPQILNQLRVLKARSSAVAPTLTIASEEERDTAVAEAKALGFVPEEIVVDSSLIRGWRATQKGTLIDRSGKRALTDLYRNITS